MDGLGELGGHCGWHRGAWRPLWMAMGNLEAVVDGLGELGGRCGWLRGTWRPL